MSEFHYANGQLCAERVALNKVAERFATPAYVYSRAAIESQWHAYDDALAERQHLICYAVKANSNLAVLSLLAELGSGFDIVSVGELERVLKAGGDPSKIVFSGVGKRTDEIKRALDVKIKCFNVESLSELSRLDQIAAEKNLIAKVSLRINPDVDAETHPYISTGLKETKFGIAYDRALESYIQARDMTNIDVVGIDCHIGSQITTIAPYIDALGKLLDMVSELRANNIELQHIDVGGGLGIRYQDESPPAPQELIKAVCDTIADTSYEILLEPGRSIVGNAAVLLTRVEYIKENSGRNFAIVDAAMNDMLRPALYDAWLSILTVNEQNSAAVAAYDIVGPVCESGDFIGLNRELSLQEGDLLAIQSAGAYGFTMSSNYNTRPRAVEVMIDGSEMIEVRRRETVAELMEGESTL
ncbi:MAG: diaminopimelate decarboxylase [Gammaproteobacteria bacterium]|mgnify:CR=1 FL=1|jgi:diaminopimelate decarboxylase|nr:diaminopimelate decarboxylase [Gammaproteobacteria bacterium]